LSQISLHFDQFWLYSRQLLFIWSRRATQNVGDP